MILRLVAIGLAHARHEKTGKSRDQAKLPVRLRAPSIHAEKPRKVRSVVVRTCAHNRATTREFVTPARIRTRRIRNPGANQACASRCFPYATSSSFTRIAAFVRCMSAR